MRPISLLLLLAVLLAACDLLDTVPDAADPTPTIAIPTPADTPPPVTPDPIVSTPTVQPLRLTVWTLAAFAPRDDVPGGNILAQQLADFDASHPDVSLQVEVKTIADQGGALAYLRTGRTIAPSVLPDILLLPTEHLGQAVRQGLIYPLEGLLEPEMRDDLYPAAAELGRVDDILYAYPATLSDLHHLAYNGEVLSDTVPADWATFLATSSATFAFPGDGARGADLVLQHYLARGGPLVTEAGQPVLDVAILTTVLTDLATAVDQGRIVPQSGTIISLDGAWQLFQTGGATMVQTSAALFLRERAIGTDARYAPLPGITGPLVPLLSGRAWVVTTADPVQQALAIELIAWLNSPTNLGEWSLQSQTLPARRSAFDAWGEGDSYVGFLREELERAQARPLAAGGTVLGALSTAVADVITRSQTPAAAAAEAAAMIAP